MKALGYRSPFTYKKLPLLPSLELTNDVLEIERLVREYKNEELHQFVLSLKDKNHVPLHKR